MKTPLLLILLLASLLSTASAEDLCSQPSPDEMAEALGLELPSRPWHLTNIFWKLESEVENFETFTQTIHIDRDVPESYNLYISPIGSGRINGLMFYGGLQTNINGWADIESRTRVSRGRGGIFSRWSDDLKTPIGLEHVRTSAPECLVESAGYEGEFASVRRPIDWTKGLWTYQIRKLETEILDSTAHTWFECRIKSPDNKWTSIGQLRFEGENFCFSPDISAFVEVYQTSGIPKSGIPEVEVTFGWPSLNGEPAKIKEALAYYPNTAIQAAPDCATAESRGSQVLVKVGKIFKRDPKMRMHPLELSLPAQTDESKTQ